MKQLEIGQWTLKEPYVHNNGQLPCEMCGNDGVAVATINISTLQVGMVSHCIDCNTFHVVGSEMIKFSVDQQQTIIKWLEEVEKYYKSAQPIKKQWRQWEVLYKSLERDEKAWDRA